MINQYPGIMKLAQVFFAVTSMIIFLLIVFSNQLFAAENALQSLVNRGYNFMVDNWPYVALAVSEIAAFLPAKVNGILQSFLRIGSYIFKKRK